VYVGGRIAIEQSPKKAVDFVDGCGPKPTRSTDACGTFVRIDGRDPV